MSSSASVEFVIGDDGKHGLCAICADGGELIICDNEKCPLVYHVQCIQSARLPEPIDDDTEWFCTRCDGNHMINRGLPDDAAILSFEHIQRMKSKHSTVIDKSKGRGRTSGPSAPAHRALSPATRELPSANSPKVVLRLKVPERETKNKDEKAEVKSSKSLPPVKEIKGSSSHVGATIKGSSSLIGATIKGSSSLIGATTKGSSSFIGATIKGSSSLIGVTSSSKSPATAPPSRPHSFSEPSVGPRVRRARRCHNCDAPSTGLVWLALDKSDMTIDKFSTTRLAAIDVQPDKVYCDNEECEESLNLFIDEQLKIEQPNEKRKRLELIRSRRDDDDIKPIEKSSHKKSSPPSSKKPRLQEGSSSKQDVIYKEQAKPQLHKPSSGSGQTEKVSKEQQPSHSKLKGGEKPQHSSQPQPSQPSNGPKPLPLSSASSSFKGGRTTIDLSQDTDDESSEHDSQSCPTDVVDGDND